MNSLTWADDEKVEKSALPANIAAKFDQLAGKDKVTKYEIEKDKNGKVCYEAKIKTASGKKEIKLDADGKVIEIEKEVKVSALPKAVVDAIKAAHPKSEIEEAEHVTAGGKQYFEVEVEDADDNEIELKVSPEGKILSTKKEHDDDDDEDDDK
jgi:uncharacterized membrane protein YkoI